MFTLEQSDCRVITAPLSLSVFLASQVTSFSHHHIHRPISTRKTILDHPLQSTVHFPSPTQRFKHAPLKLKISACSRNSTPVTDRLLSASIYSLPLLDGLTYGAHRVPLELYPRIYHLYNSTPFTRFVAFYIIVVFVMQNPRIDKYVRLNTVQALILGFLLQAPAGILKVIMPVWPVGMRIGYDFMCLVLLFGFIYIMVNTILGKTPQFPFVTHAAKMHIRGS